MGRPPRSDPSGGWHHVVNRGVARRDIFADDVDRVEFGRLLGVAHDRFGVRVHAYCLMTNHYHLLVECPDGGLSDAMHLIGSVYVRHFNERSRRDGPLFRGRFFAGPIRSDAAVVAVARYIHRNPLAIVTPDRLEAYRWSSLRTYLGHRRRPPFMRTDVVSALSGGPAGVRELAGSSVSGMGSSAVGSPMWAHLTDLMVDEHLEGVATNRASRTVQTLMLDRLSGGAAREVRSLLAFPSANAEKSARSRARRRAREHPVYLKAVGAVIDAAA